MAEAKIQFAQRQCKVILTEEQKREQADIMATRAQLIETIEAEKKSSNAYFKERLERVSGEIRTAARLYKDGYDWTDVECAVIKDWEYGEILYIRVDTCELAHVENMSQAERQHHIDEYLDQPDTFPKSDGTEESPDPVNDGDKPGKKNRKAKEKTDELKPGRNSGFGAGVGTGQDTGSNAEITSQKGISRILTGETTTF